MSMQTLSRLKYWASKTLPPKLYWNLMGQFKPVPAVTSEYDNVDDCLASGQQVVDLLDGLGVLRPDAVTLHIGAGLGRVEAHLRHRVATCYGADISESMVRRARRLVPYDNVRFFVIDGRGLSELPVARFDLIYSFLVFQHLPRPQFSRYVTEAYSRLADGGHFVFHLMVDETGTRPDPPASHPYGLRYYRRADVEDELLRAGFAAVTRRTLDGAPDDGSTATGDVVFCATAVTNGTPATATAAEVSAPGTTRHPAVVGGAGRLSRRLHEAGVVRGRASGVVRRLASHAAAHGTVVYRNQAGHLVTADLGDYMERSGFFGAHGAALVRFVSAHLNPGDWAIDAGANVGLITSPMAAAVGRTGSVWAVEPFPRNVERLRALKDANGLEQLEIFPVALSSTSATAELRLSATPGGSGFPSFVAPWAGDQRLEVATRTLDELVEAHAPDRPLRLLKIDVEGAEGDLLAGARRTLTRLRPTVICELHDSLLRAAGTSADGLLETFAELGYVTRPPFDRPPGPLDGAVVDVLLVPEERAGAPVP